MARQADSVLYPPRLQPGDRVRLISPASTPKGEGVERFVKLLKNWGLEPEIAPHAFDVHGSYLAGTDEARLTDLNEAIRDPGVRAKQEDQEPSLCFDGHVGKDSTFWLRFYKLCDFVESW